MARTPPNTTAEQRARRRFSGQPASRQVGAATAPGSGNDRFTITVRANGPLIVDGTCELRDEQGRAYSQPNGAKLALCRCSASDHRPFCDGAHARSGFVSPSSADPEAPEPTQGDWEDDGGSVEPVHLTPQESDEARAHLRMHRLMR